MPPAVLDRLCSHFHQDMDVLYRDEVELISAYIEDVGESDARDLLTYLRTDLLRRRPEEMEEVWDSCGSDMFLVDAAATLQRVADTIDAALAQRWTSD
jgi:hypothetical protein